MDANAESLFNLRSNLQEQGTDLAHLPYVIQYNKRDIEDPIPIAELVNALNPSDAPQFEACATRGDGVFDTLKAVARDILRNLDSQRDTLKASA